MKKCPIVLIPYSLSPLWENYSAGSELKAGRYLHHLKLLTRLTYQQGNLHQNSTMVNSQFVETCFVHEELHSLDHSGMGLEGQSLLFYLLAID